MSPATCQDCGAPATALYLDAYGPGQDMPVCDPDSLYYDMNGATIRPLPPTPEQAHAAYTQALASSFRYVRLSAIRTAKGLPPFPQDPPF